MRGTPAAPSPFREGRTLASRPRSDLATAMATNSSGGATARESHLLPPVLAARVAVFRPCFTARIWNHVLVLVVGAVLAPGKRTVA